MPAKPSAAISVSVDSTFIRSCEEGERHLEVKVGNAETDAGINGRWPDYEAALAVLA